MRVFFTIQPRTVPSRRSPPRPKGRHRQGCWLWIPGFVAGLTVWGKSGVILWIMAFPHTCGADVSLVRVTSSRAQNALPGERSNYPRVFSAAKAIPSFILGSLEAFSDTKAVNSASEDSHRRSSTLCPMSTEGYKLACHVVCLLSLYSCLGDCHCPDERSDTHSCSIPRARTTCSEVYSSTDISE